MKRETIRDQAEALAEIIQEIAQWPKNHPNAKRYAMDLVKIPPVFLVDNEKHGCGRSNLVAMIETLSDYEESDDLKLSDLPARYNANGGGPTLSMRDMRKTHNWLQQVSFAIRAAAMEQEMRKDANDADIAERVFRRLYANRPRRAFVALAPDSRYGMKPLRYASDNAKRQWIRQERQQRAENARNYGARPTSEEWSAFGLRGRTRTLASTRIARVREFQIEASRLDEIGEHIAADEADFRLMELIALEGRWTDFN